jgi:hypothetical protein
MRWSQFLALSVALTGLGPSILAQETCPKLVSVSIQATVSGASAPTKSPVYARKDQPTVLFAVVKAKQGGKTVSFGALPGEPHLHAPELWPEECPIELQWTKVEALPVSYNNAHSAPPAHIETAHTPWRKGWQAAADVHPTRMHDEYPESKTGYGAMRFMLTVRSGQHSVSSPGQECRRSGALCPDVFTLAIRPDDSYLGYLHELLNTPYIYGSKGIKGGHQSDLLVGSDCADFAIYGKRRQRSKKAFPYTYTGGLYKYAAKRTRVSLDDDGFYLDSKGRRLTFSGKGQVQPGDLLNLPDGHVGVLFRDDGNGFLDTRDFLMHTLFREPEIVPIEACRWNAINGKEVLRLKN